MLRAGCDNRPYAKFCALKLLGLQRRRQLVSV